MISEQAMPEGKKFLQTDKLGCRLIAEALKDYGIRHVVVSPGSRNAPLIMAVTRSGWFSVTTIVDERSAAFIGLGIAEITGEPVALICTSGSAVLNYAPALSEAYYRQIPLIAISADRPVEWIDQNDSQTIRQPGALKNIVRNTVSFKGELTGTEEIEFVNRKLNDVLSTATSGVKGPVHINISLSNPLSHECEWESSKLFHKIDIINTGEKIAVETARALSAHIHGKKILIAGSISAPNSQLSMAIGIFTSLPYVVVICEGLSNIHATGILHQCDLLFSQDLNDEQLDILSPDLIISFGGAPVSSAMKTFLRRCTATQHWHVGKSDGAIDCFRKLSTRIEISPEGFFPRIASSLAHLEKVSPSTNNFARKWHEHAQSVAQAINDRMTGIAETEKWNAPYAIETLLQSIPSAWNLQLGNGMAVRYALASSQIQRFHRADSNRGVSGIDGCISTAIGASTAYKGTTLLITGDMSAQYDIGAISSGLLTPKLKIVVLNNGGGGIFHYVKTTRELPEIDKYFSCDLVLPMQQLADAYGICYLRATNWQELADAIRLMMKEDSKAVCLEIVTDPKIDAAVFRKLTNE